MTATAQQHVASCEIRADGALIDDTLASMLTEVRVRDSLSLPASALLKFADPQLRRLDSHPLQLGSELVVAMGAIGAGAPVKVFKGEVVAHEPEFDQEGITIVIRAYDKAHRLQRARKVRTFQQVSASDMVRTIAGEAGLTGSAESTGFVHEFFQQSAETDREFIRRLERRYDFEFVMEDGRYAFRKAGEGRGEVALEYGKPELLSFRPRLTAAEQLETVEVRGWDPKAMQAITGTASNGADPGAIGVQRSKVATTYPGTSLVADRTLEESGEAGTLAKAALDRRAAQFVEAEGACVGSPAIRAGKRLRITGLGTKLSGEYHVTSATHVMRSVTGTYQSHFQISGRSERGLLDLMHPPEKRDWAQHVVVGVVTNNNDPDGMGRVRVKFPALDEGLDSAWARVLTHNAGNERGIFMVPQPNDEVVVAFENGDTRRPLVIGSVFNGKNVVGDELLARRDGTFVVAADKQGHVHTKEDLTLKSDQKLIVQVTSDHEEKTDGNVSQEAGGGAKLKVGSSYEVEAGAGITIKGATIAVEAQGSLKLKGATVDIEASGPATLKGAIVDINAQGVANLKGTMVNIG
jgi:phage protein D/phage baseplate assembly protein gpV